MLEQYLGPGFDILKSIWNEHQIARRFTTNVDANWRLGHHISLDDYHIVAVHPTTFGKNGYLPPEVVNYHRFGRHSAFFYNADGASLEKMAEDCRNGTFRPDTYRIIQFFPNLLAVMSSNGLTDGALLQQFVPVAHDRTVVRTIMQDPRMTPGRRAVALRRLMVPLIRVLQKRIVRQVLGEDNAVCAKMQAVVHQLDRPQILGRQEQRIAWFEENYEEIVESACS